MLPPFCIFYITVSKCLQSAPSRLSSLCGNPVIALRYIGELAQWYNTRPLIQRSPVRFRAPSPTGVVDYDEACLMHLTPGAVHNFPRAVGV